MAYPSIFFNREQVLKLQVVQVLLLVQYYRLVMLPEEHIPKTPMAVTQVQVGDEPPALVSLMKMVRRSISGVVAVTILSIRMGYNGRLNHPMNMAIL